MVARQRSRFTVAGKSDRHSSIGSWTNLESMRRNSIDCGSCFVQNNPAGNTAYTIVEERDGIWMEQSW